jgi:hypothetical protein
VFRSGVPLNAVDDREMFWPRSIEESQDWVHLLALQHQAGMHRQLPCMCCARLACRAARRQGRQGQRDRTRDVRFRHHWI